MGKNVSETTSVKQSSNVFIITNLETDNPFALRSLSMKKFRVQYIIVKVCKNLDKNWLPLADIMFYLDAADAAAEYCSISVTDASKSSWMLRRQ
jgi:hypothetical protein